MAFARPSDRPATPIDWHADALRARLDPLLPGVSVEVAPTLPSTNTELLARARCVPPARRDADQEAVSGMLRPSVESRAFARQRAAPCLLIAERQTAGRGRQGRRWHAEPGASLTFSLALALDAVDWSGLSLAVGVALAEALDPVPDAGGYRLGLKWPNDLWLIDPARGARATKRGSPDGSTAIGRKLGGVLIETVASATGGPRLAVIGVGLNIAALAGVAAEGLSSGLAALTELDPQIDAPTALARLAAPVAEALRRFERDGFAAFAERYERRDLLRGRPVVTTSAGVAGGIARGIAVDGALRVETADGCIVALTSGEVSVRPVPVGAAKAKPEAAAC